MLYTEYTNLLTNYIKDISNANVNNSGKLKELALLRDFNSELLSNLGIVYVGKGIDLLHPKYLNVLERFGIVRDSNVIYQNRYIIPILDVYSKVVGLVGYSASSKRRYMYANGMYYNRRNTMYGLHNIDSIVSEGYAIIVEGITDAIALYNIGYKNVLANCGTHKNRLGEDITKRLKHGVIIIPDNDVPGQRAYNTWDFNSNKVKIELSGYKDISEFLHNSTISRITNLRAVIDNSIQHLKDISSLGVTNTRVVGISNNV